MTKNMLDLTRVVEHERFAKYQAFISGFRFVSKRGRVSILFYVLISLIGTGGDALIIYLIGNPGRFLNSQLSESSKPVSLMVLIVGFAIISKPLFGLILPLVIFRQLANEEAFIASKAIQHLMRSVAISDRSIADGEFVNLSMNSPSSLVRGILMRGSLWVSSVLNTAIIAFSLVLIEPLATLFCLLAGFLFFGVSSVLYRRVSRRIGRKKISAIQDEINMTGLGYAFAKLFQVMPSKSYVKTQRETHVRTSNLGAKTEVLAISPRVVIEMISLSSLVLVLLIAFKEPSSGGTLELGTAFGFAGFRILLLTSQIQAISIQMDVELDNANHVLKILSINQPMVENDETMQKGKDSNALLEAVGISYVHSESQGYTVNHITLSVRKGERVAIVGRSGAGKTTLMELLMGIKIPTSGRITWNSVHNPTVAYVPQNFVPCGLDVKHSVALEWTESTIDEKTFDELVLQFETLGVLSRNDFYSNRQDSEFSIGQQQIFSVMRALYRKPAVLFLDEPTSALDQVTQSKILNLIMDDETRTVVMVAHRPETLATATKILYLQNGQLFESDPETSVLDGVLAPWQQNNT